MHGWNDFSPIEFDVDSPFIRRVPFWKEVVPNTKKEVEVLDGEVRIV